MKAGKEELRIHGLSLQARFVFAMTAALAVVMTGTALLIHAAMTRMVEKVQRDSISSAVRFTDERPAHDVERQGWQHENGVQIFPFHYGTGGTGEGLLYRHESEGPDGKRRSFDLLVPAGKAVGRDMLRVIAGIFVVVLLAGIGVSLWVAGQVSRPVRGLIDDVRAIAKGDLRHRTKAAGPGEIQLLARAIDRMTSDLDEARETQLELSVRDRELDLAAGVREALLPTATPLIEGYDLGAAFVASPRFGGDFHDFVERPDGRLGLLVCDVGGRGVPAALVGATARSYLRSELARAAEVEEALRQVNRWLAGDVRRGMFVTALYALLDPAAGRATVACAGHKIPLLRLCKKDGSLRVVQPDGIALGFDKGPVFERRLQVVETPIEPGDRLVLANSAPVRIRNDKDEELGEKAFYARVKKHAALETTPFLRALRRDLEQFAGASGLQEDISLVTLSRS